jgi:hypothetical protein
MTFEEEYEEKTGEPFDATSLPIREVHGLKRQTKYPWWEYKDESGEWIKCGIGTCRLILAHHGIRGSLASKILGHCIGRPHYVTDT